MISSAVGVLVLFSSQLTSAAPACKNVHYQGKEQRVEYAGLSYDIPTLSKKGLTLRPEPAPQHLQQMNSRPIGKSLNKVWDLNEFQTPRLPEWIANVKNLREFSHSNGVRVLELPIKLPGSEIKIPQELAQFKDVIQEAINAERALNPDYDGYYAYLTVDQGHVVAGTTQRIPGVHVDGFQGARQVKKYEPDHSYIVTDAVPTVFYKQQFETNHLSEKHNYFEEMNRQAYPLASKKITPYKIYLMDAYSLHRADLAKESQDRTFLRITFSKHRYDRLGETDNPLFPTWERHPRFIPPKLETFKPTSENFVGPGFTPEIKGLRKENLIIENPTEYVQKQLGAQVVEAAKNPHTHFVVATGKVSDAKRASEKLGWKWNSEVSKEEGFHRILQGQHESGATGYLIVRVNSPERLVHVHALLNLAGVTPDRVYTTGSFKSWKREIKSQLNSLPPPDAVFYGFSNSMIDGVLRLNDASMVHHGKIRDVYNLRRKPVELGDHEMSNMWVSVLKTKEGQTYWFMPNLYGSMVKDIFSVLSEMKIPKLVYLGTAGAIDPSLRVGDRVTPLITKNQQGRSVNVPPLIPLPESRTVQRHEPVPTFLIETQQWLNSATTAKASVTEVELSHVVAGMQNSKTSQLAVSLIVSDVLQGPHKKDITQFEYQDNKNQIEYFGKVFKTISGLTNKRAEINEFSWFPLIRHSN